MCMDRVAFGGMGGCKKLFGAYGEREENLPTP